MRLRKSGAARRFGWALLAIVMTLGLAEAAEEAAPPLPPPRPDRSAAPSEQPREQAKPSDIPKPQVTKPEVAKPQVTKPEAKPTASAVDGACAERLTRLGVRFETRPAVQEYACNVEDAVLVSAMPDGVEISPPSLMRCPTAESLARWNSDALATEANRHFQSHPTKILIGTSYQCRDQRFGGKLSEHAFGNAVDIMGFEFAKRGPLTIGFQAEGSPEAAFQSAVQKGACPVFTTVLGPGSDADHGNHLHLDMRARKGDYRICQ
jgi:hypothetical protein